jgi:TRAP-type C4-dicarboxylate transport system permease small subunit
MKRAIRRLWSAIDLIMAGLLVAMIALVFANVVSSGIRQAVELARLWFVWVVMLGAAAALRRNEHLAVAEFSEKFLPRAVPLLRRLCWAVVMVAVIMLFIGALNQTVANWGNLSSLTGLPSGLFYLAGVVSAVLMAATAAVRLIDPMQTGIARTEDAQ